MLTRLLLIAIMLMGCLSIKAMDDQAATSDTSDATASTDAAPSPDTSVEIPTGQDQTQTPESAPAPEPAPPAPAPEQKEIAPEPVQERPQEIINYGEGVDTLDVESGGNWLKKRVIWEDAQAKYEKIKSSLSQIFDSRMEFFSKRSDVDKELNLFFVDIGFAQGELEETLQTLLDLIELDRQQQGSLNAQERDIREQLVEKKQELEQLKADAKSIADLDAALDESVTQVIKQINLAVGYEKQAWKKFKDIGQELNDKKAKEDYIYMDTMQKNIDDIAHYISGPLLEYANTVLGKINEYMSSIKDKLATIKSSGIELKQKLTELEQAAKAKKAEQKATQEVVKKKPKTWVDSISFIWTYPISWVKKIWDLIFGLFGK